MLGNNSHITTTAALALAALVLFSAYSTKAMAAAAEELDGFGIEKIYPTKQGGNEWYVDMDDPTDDLRNIENVEFKKNPDGSWHVSARQIRMEAWSNENEKWQNVEMTMYAKIEGGTSDDLLQMYSRGGHHSSRDPCSGSAYKARLYEDGRAAWTKEVTHPAYAKNRDVTRVTDDPLEDRWVGFKAVIYNIVQDGKTYVRMESYIDDNVTDENGDLAIGNNWELASVVEDRGGWATPDGDFASNCGMARDAILAAPGGSGDRNIVAWRSDGTDWSFKYLSAREIDPLQEQLPDKRPAPEEETPEDSTGSVDNEEPVTEESGVDMTGYVKVASKQVASDGNSAVSAVDMQVRKQTVRSSGTIVAGILVEGRVVAASEPIGTGGLDSIEYRPATAIFNPPVGVDGDYEVAIFYLGSGGIQATIAS